LIEVSVQYRKNLSYQESRPKYHARYSTASSQIEFGIELRQV